MLCLIVDLLHSEAVLVQNRLLRIPASHALGRDVISVQIGKDFPLGHNSSVRDLARHRPSEHTPHLTHNLPDCLWASTCIRR
jgi:hypothetical protein